MLPGVAVSVYSMEPCIVREQVPRHINRHILHQTGIMVEGVVEGDDVVDDRHQLVVIPDKG